MRKKRSILLVGSPGSGKTVSAETLEGATVYFSFDPNGWLSLERTPCTPETRRMVMEGKLKQRTPKKLKFAPTLRGWLADPNNHLERDEILILDYEAKTNKIQTGLTTDWQSDIFIESSTDINLIAEGKAAGRGISHGWFDSLTGWQWAVLEAIVRFRGPTKSGYTGTDQDTYGKAIEKIREIVDTCCHLPIDFIFTAHIQTDKDDLIGRIKEELSIYGKKLPELIASMIDDIYLSSVDMSGVNPQYKWSAHPTDFFKALRTRSFDNLPRVFDANFQKLYGERLAPLE
jgi:hypothetical protein